jgi:isocitrate dehydrogenase
VNPVLREGNSDRRAPLSVKNYARKHPHRMGKWSSDSKSHVAHMDAGDFYGSEKSATLAAAGSLKIELTAPTAPPVLKDKTAVKAGEIVDAAVMSATRCARFVAGADRRCQGQGRAVLAAPEGHDDEGLRPDHVRRGGGEFYKDVLAKHADALKQAGFDPNNGIGDLYARLPQLPEACASHQGRPRRRIRASARPGDGQLRQGHHQPARAERRHRRRLDAGDDPRLRPHVERDGKLQDTKAVIPDRCYAGVYQAVIDDCKAHGAFDPATMGSVPNVGLMAQKAEEYGSHDKTFEIAADGTVRVVDEAGKVCSNTP